MEVDIDTVDKELRRRLLLLDILAEQNEIQDLIIINKSLSTLDRLLLQRHFVDQNENEDTRRICSCQQSTTFRGIAREHYTANRNENYRKNQRNDEKKLMKAYVYANQLN